MAVQIPRAPYWQPALGRAGEVVEGLAELGQAIALVLTTVVGSVPLAPEFGCDVWKLLDQPMNRAIPAAIREVTQALRRCEPRIQIVKVSIRRDTGVPTLQVTWRPRSDAPFAAVAGATFNTTLTAGTSLRTGAPGGVAPLNAAGLVPPQFLPPAPAVDLDWGRA